MADVPNYVTGLAYIYFDAGSSKSILFTVNLKSSSPPWLSSADIIAVSGSRKAFESGSLLALLGVYGWITRGSWLVSRALGACYRLSLLEPGCFAFSSVFIL